MSDVIEKKPSLWRYAFRELRKALSAWARYIVGAGLLLGLIYFGMKYLRPHFDPVALKQIAKSPELLKQNPELQHAYSNFMMNQFKAMAASIFELLLFQSLTFYFFSVKYLQRLFPEKNITLTVHGLLYWYGKCLWKYCRPILWNLLPVIGQIFYIRSIVRYILVGPLAILDSSSELKTSWAMTEGNWWRIFGNQWMLGLVIGFWGFLFLGLPALIIGVLKVFAGFSAWPVDIVASLLQGFFLAIATASSAIFICTVYRVRLDEQAANPAT